MKIVYRFIASGFGSGYSPVAPGTAGAIVGCFIIWLLHLLLPETGYAISTIILFLLLFLIGVKASAEMEKEWGEDASKITIDEVVGMGISVFWLPFSWYNLLLAFIFFRIYDIFKPFFIRKLESLKNGWGVMGDDLLAGVYTNLTVHLIIYASTKLV